MLDARPRANAWANMAMGGGFESVGGSTYPQCELEFLDIENIHVMRSSLAQLKYLIESSSDEKTNDSSFLAKLDSAGWMGHVKLVLEGGLRVVKHLKAGYVIARECCY
jgi:myotubularin-related protein 1/2